MEKIKVRKIRVDKSKQTYQIDYTCSAKELFDKFEIGNNDGSNTLISSILERIRPKLRGNISNYSDTWELANKKDLINLKFTLNLMED